jgi:DNA recombination-dependent growth factor C
MVVVVKASVAAEQLEKALLATNKTPGMRCNSSQARHYSGYCSALSVTSAVLMHTVLSTLQLGC